MGDKEAWKDKELVNRLYHQRNMSAYEIADKLGCSYQPIYERIDKTRSQSNAMSISHAKKPTHYRTGENGYEEWKCNTNGEQKTVLVHRLVAVAEYGFDEVSGKVIHHDNRIPWDNRPDNLKPMTDSNHKAKHANLRSRDKGRFC
jgi:hypothetical protein